MRLCEGLNKPVLNNAVVLDCVIIIPKGCNDASTTPNGTHKNPKGVTVLL